MKANKKALFLLLYVPLLVMGCKNTVTYTELIQWMEDKENGFRQVKNENEITYTLQYKTIDYITAKRNNVSVEASDNMERIKSDAKNNLLFDLFITCPDGPIQYRVTENKVMNDRYNYYHFNFAEHIHLEAADIKIKPNYCMADKGSGLNSTMSFSIGFPNSIPDGQDFKFVINDTQLGTGTVKFLFKHKYFDRIPSIKN